eukprot:8890804-Pyramimonas_sp.AAC.1
MLDVGGPVVARLSTSAASPPPPPVAVALPLRTPASFTPTFFSEASLLRRLCAIVSASSPQFPARSPCVSDWAPLALHAVSDARSAAPLPWT